LLNGKLRGASFIAQYLLKWRSGWNGYEKQLVSLYLVLHWYSLWLSHASRLQKASFALDLNIYMTDKGQFYIFVDTWSFFCFLYHVNMNNLIMTFDIDFQTSSACYTSFSILSLFMIFLLGWFRWLCLDRNGMNA
jgi:hypothetical protein